MNSTKFNFRIKDADGLLRFTGTDDSWFTLEQAREVISANLHAVYFFKDRKEVLEFIKNYDGHQATRCKRILEIELEKFFDEASNRFFPHQ